MLLSSEAAKAALESVSGLLGEGVVALRCFEQDHSQGHRRIVVDMLRRRRDVVLVEA